MRLNNKNSKSFVFTVYFIFIVLFIFLSLFFNFLEGLIANNMLRYMALIGILISVFILMKRAAKYFEYDSDGTVLVAINKGLLFSDLINYRENRAEFPKAKLLYYKLNNYGIYKSLNLYIRSGAKRQKRLKFNVTLVKNKKLKYLKQSLDKVVKHNNS